jgi:hypothetical protein
MAHPGIHRTLPKVAAKQRSKAQAAQAFSTASQLTERSSAAPVRFAAGVFRPL